MKYSAFLWAVLWCTSVMVSAQETGKDFVNYQVIEVGGLAGFQSEDEVFSRLELPLDEDLEIIHADVAHGTVHMLVRPELLDQFKKSVQANKLSYEVIIDDVGALIEIPKSGKTEPKGASTFERYMTPGEVEAFLQAVSEAHPEKVKLNVIGRSYNLANITMATISGQSKRTKGHPKPIIFVEAGMHAREWIGVSSAVHLIEKLTGAGAPQAHEVEWRIVPVANPDGYKYSWNGNRLWRKNRHRYYDSPCYGVDLNRNFGSFWGEAGTSNRKCSAVYGGTSAFSEPESRAIRDAVLGASGRVKAFISLHSYGQLLFYPPGGSFLTLPKRTTTALNSISRKMSRSIRKEAGANYTTGSPAQLLYAASGISMDWALCGGGVPLPFTFELRDTGKRGFLLPSKDIEPAVKDVWVAMKTLHDQVRTMSRKRLDDLLVKCKSAVAEPAPYVAVSPDNGRLDSAFEFPDVNGDFTHTLISPSHGNTSVLESTSAPEETTANITQADEGVGITGASALPSTTQDDKEIDEATEEAKLPTTEVPLF